MAEAEELLLVDRIRAGDTSAWMDLLTGYQNRLYAVCFRMVRNPETAADLTQDAMVKIIQGLDRYDGRARLSTWMIRITMNVCLSWLRAQKLRRHASLDAPQSGKAPRTIAQSLDQSREQPADARVEYDERHEALLAALFELAPDHRAILLLRDAHDMEYDQIAQVLDIAVGTVKSRLFRARTALRNLIEPKQ